MTNNNNLITEIAAIALALILVAVGVALLVLHYITFNEAIGIWGLAAGLFVSNLVYKAPSPSQQQQLGVQQQQLSAQQQNLQQLLAYALNLLPGLLQSVGQPAQAPVAPPQPQQTAVPVQPAAQSSPVVASPSVPTAMLQPQVAPVLPQRDDFSQSALMRAVGQFPPQPPQAAQPAQPAVFPVIPARPSLAHPGASNVSAQQQQFRPQPVSIPEVSMPMAAMPKQ